jgi:hypothetical protein
VSRNRASAKKAGTAWESAICAFLVAHGWIHVERRRLAGSADRGDIAGIPGLVIEAKNTRGYDLAAAVDESSAERDNAGAQYGVAWFKRKGRASPGSGYVVMTGETFVDLLKEAGH